MSSIEIKSFEKGQETSVSRLISEVYDEFVAPGYTAEGNAFFHAFIEPASILKRHERQNNLLLAFNGGILAGMIEMRDNNHVSLLFTRKEFMGKGIARELLREGILVCLSRKASTPKIYVHASPYSIPIYERLGFQASGLLMQNNGITYLPMEMKLF